jgi:hypothetical protein
MYLRQWYGFRCLISNRLSCTRIGILLDGFQDNHYADYPTTSLDVSSSLTY